MGHGRREGNRGKTGGGGARAGKVQDRGEAGVQWGRLRRSGGGGEEAGWNVGRTQQRRMGAGVGDKGGRMGRK